MKRKLLSQDEPSWTCIYTAPEPASVADAELVLTAIGIDSRTVRIGAEWTLWVLGTFAPRATAELAAYRAENRRPAPSPPPPPTIDSGWPGVLTYLLIIWMLPTLESSVAFGWNWRSIGTLHAGLVMQGEWWRTITALTLHGSLSHLVANSAFGAVFGLFVGRYLGSGLGWLLVILSAALANGLNAAIEPDTFRSIGASTATFASLALVATFVWRRGYYRTTGWRRSAAPMFAAFALLAYTGVGGGAEGPGDADRVDIVAHFAGFFFGVVAGLIAAQLDIERLGKSAQILSGATTLALIAGAWWLAGSNA